MFIFWRSLGTSAFLSRMSTPSIRIEPPLGRSRRLRQRRNVLLPVPEGPMMEMTSPRFISTLTSRSTVTSPNLLERCSTLIMPGPPSAAATSGP